MFGEAEASGKGSMRLRRSAKARCCDELRSDVELARLQGCEQWRCRCGTQRRQRRAVLEERRHGSGMAADAGEQQSRPLPAGTRVDEGSVRGTVELPPRVPREYRNHRRVAKIGGAVQRAGQIARLCGLHGRASAQQRLRHVSVAVLGRKVEGRGPVWRRGGCVGRVREQRPHNLHVTGARSKHQRR